MKAPKALLLDMDGVLYQGDRVLPYAVEFIKALHPLPFAFITNNPILLPTDIAQKLQRLGFGKIDPRQIITSGIATAKYLASLKQSFTCYAIGAEGLHQALSQYGTVGMTQVDFVVVGEGEGIDFDSLTLAINLITQEGAKLISTNPDASVDATCNGKHCLHPGGGALVAPIAIATGQQPVTIGKPSPLLYEMALTHLGVPASDCLMVGDRPDTDILGAQQLGMMTALVRTGRFQPGDTLPLHIQPDIDVNDLHTLQTLIPLPDMLPDTLK